jgi:hypothetical protein
MITGPPALLSFHRPDPMDSGPFTLLLRQLFRHPACQSVRPRPSSALRKLSLQRRSFLTQKSNARRKTADDGMYWTKRDDYPKDIREELRTYPFVTAKDLRHRRGRPREVKMLTREFIDGKKRDLFFQFTLAKSAVQIACITHTTDTSRNTPPSSVWAHHLISIALRMAQPSTTS